MIEAVAKDAFGLAPMFLELQCIDYEFKILWMMPPKLAPKIDKRTTNKGNPSDIFSYANIRGLISNTHVIIPRMTLRDACSIGLLTLSRKTNHCDRVRMIIKRIADGIEAIAAC